MFSNVLRASRQLVWTIGTTLVFLFCKPVCGFAEESLSCFPPANSSEFAAKWDFFTNFGQYMPRMNCLRTTAGSPDWFWGISLIVLNVIVVTACVRIFIFWLRCYYVEEARDRDEKLLDLAYIFGFCATCGYGFAIVTFFWPVYRMQAMFLVGLAIISWRFALNLEPFRASFASRRLQRELNEVLQRDNHELEREQLELARANGQFARTSEELKISNQSLDEFVYAASHDLKSPLRAIDSLSQFIIEDTGDGLSEQSNTDLQELRRRVQKMEGLLDGLLEYSRSRKATFPMEEIKLSSLVQECIDVLDVPDRFSVENSVVDINLIAPSPPLEQVIRNLIDNGVKHHDKPAGKLSVSARQDAEYVEVTVSDDGPGIPPQYQGRIFEMFTKYKKSDTMDSNGIGLSIVKRIVEVHGGTILVESILGEGTTFRFTWPSTVTDWEQRKSSNRVSPKLQPRGVYAKTPDGIQPCDATVAH